LFGRFGERGNDWWAGLAGVTVPVLAVAAEADREDPPWACRKLLEQFGSECRHYYCLGRRHGHSDDYGHIEMLVSKPAQGEGWGAGRGGGAARGAGGGGGAGPGAPPSAAPDAARPVRLGPPPLSRPGPPPGSSRRRRPNRDPGRQAAPGGARASGRAWAAP